MTLNLLRIAAIILCGATVALASPLTWTINSTASNYTLKIPDQSVTISGVTLNIQIRNQNGSAWTSNIAKLQGTVATNYDVMAQKIQFLGGQTNISAINSGNYRPNPASWNLTINNNSYQNTSTAPAAFGALVRTPQFGVVLIQVDLGNFNIFDVNLDLASNYLPISGSSVDLQANAGMNVGIASSKLDFDGNQTPVGAVKDLKDGALGTMSQNNALAGTLTSLGGSYHLVIPIQQNFTIDINGSVFQANSTGTLVLDAIPEPSALIMAVLGIVSLALCARRKLLPRGMSLEPYPRSS